MRNPANKPAKKTARTRARKPASNNSDSNLSASVQRAASQAAGTLRPLPLAPLKEVFKKSRADTDRSAVVVVAIGASASGANSLRKFLSRIEAGDVVEDIAFVLLQHLDELGAATIHELHEILHQVCPLPVVEIKPGQELAGGKLFRAPANSLVRVRNGVFEIETAEETDVQFTAIDNFFRSLAQDRKRRAIGVIFSGEGSDGAQGMKAISDAGGMTLAQLPETAELPLMPQSAISTGAVDHVLLPEDMPSKIASYVEFLGQIAQDDQSKKLRDETISALSEICEILLRTTRHDFKHYKTSTLVRRIERRMQVLQIATVDIYVDKLNADANEIDSLFKELLINVTSFFRDPEAFETLKLEVLQKALAGRRPDQKYRAWIAGCSTGEEVYSIAILIKEVLSQLSHPPEVQIIATDIDEEALNQARKGSYPATIVENVSASRLKRFFERKNGRFVVTKELREIVLFSSHNLINDPPFSQLDLISCRNVLIYLGTHLQKKLIPVFHYALRKGGFLFLGNSETLATHRELFRTVSAKFRIAQRKSTAIRHPGIVSGTSHAYVSHSVENQQSHEVDVHLISQRIVLDEFAPRYAVVNDDGLIVSVSSGIAQYFDPSEGSFQNNLMRLVKPSLRVGLRSAFGEAKKQKRQVTHQDSSLKVDDEFVRIGITVQPMPKLGDETGLYMVVFHFFGTLHSTKVASLTEARAESDGRLRQYSDASVVEQLERELASLRTDLDRSVEDLEASNEELKSSNEELLSMNEELQSANEELETSKEEVQTVNEVLIRSNTELENLLASTEIATLFLDGDLMIQNFTPQLSSIYNITRVDLGRPISHLTSMAKGEMPTLPRPSVFARDESVIEDEVELIDGRWLLRRILPYRTAEGEHSGIVVTFIDVTHLRVAEERYRQLADSMPQVVWTATPDGKLDYFNERWYEYSQHERVRQSNDAHERTGQNSDDLNSLLHPDDLEPAMAAWAHSTKTGELYETEYRLKDNASGKFRWFLARAVPSRDDDGKIIKWYGSSVDINDRVMAEQLRRESEKRFEIMADTAPVLIWMTAAEGGTSWFNRRWLEWTGRTLAQELGDGWTEGCHPDDLEACRKNFAESSAARKDFYHEFRLRHHSGEYRWLSDRGTPRYTPDGTFEGYIGGCMDIHEEKTATERIAESERHLDLLIKTSPSFMCTLSGPNYVYEQANQKYMELIGGREIIGKTFAEALPEMVEQGFLDVLDRVRTTGRSFSATELQVQIRGAGDTKSQAYFLDFVFQPVSSVSGKSRIFVHGTDVTEKVRARAVLENAKNEVDNERDNFRNLFRQTPELVCILSGENHHFEFVNDAHVKILGFDATGRQVREAQPESIEVHGILDEVYRTGQTAELIELPVTVGTRLRYFNLTYAARTDSRGHINGVMILGTEMTEQVAARNELKIARDEADDARVSAELANESKTRFLANMSHEIRTPLAAILGFSELLQGRTKSEDGEAADQLHRIARNASQLGRLIDELLDLSKIEAEKLEMDRSDFDLHSALDDALSSVGLRAREKGLNFEQRSIGDVPRIINTDPTRFRQVLTNIIGNAVKFTESGGIEVEFAQSIRDQKRYLQIRVRDTGIGLSPDQQARIFEPFVQADTSVTRKYGGTGLGLVLSKRLSKLMGGDLILEQSALGNGSCFLVTIEVGSSQMKSLDGSVVGSLDLSQQRTDAVMQAPQTPVTLEGRSILIVDDSIDNQTIITLYLRAVKATIDVASNGLEACEKMKQRRYDIVLMDIQMPVLDGYRALQLANVNGYRGPIVALTAHAMKEEKDRCLAAGFTDYLSKPIDRHRLIARILEIIETVSPSR